VVIRWLLAILLLCSPIVAEAQISGQFYLEKSTFAPGEPVFLYFQAVNDGLKAENLHSADPYSSCSGYEITVSSDPGATSTCAPLVAISCMSSSTVLLPGHKRIERKLLNFDHKIDAPGEYSIEAASFLSHASARVDFLSPATVKDMLEVHTTLFFRVDQNATQDPKAFQHWIDQLQSVDPASRSEAARTLASVAPRSLEGTLLGFANDPNLRQFAPLAFYRLNTPLSMAAMAELLMKTEPGTFEHMKSADYLAESGDLQWFPLLRDVAQKHANISNYVDDAAELGGDRMLPILLSLMNSSDKEFTRINAVTAMGATGSRSAVPILLDFLKSSDSDIADRARYALRLLTHRTARDDQDESPQSQYPKWSQWWAREGANSPIYKLSECGTYIPLP
jgi:hypothetical protein